MGAINPLYDIRYVENINPYDIWRWWFTEKSPGFIEKQNADYDNLFIRIENSIKEEGFKSPLIVTCGGGNSSEIFRMIHENIEQDPEKLKTFEKFKTREELLSTQLFATKEGDARIYIARKLGIPIRSFVLDYCGRYKDHYEVTTLEQFMDFFDPIYAKSISNVRFTDTSVDFDIDPWVKMYFKPFEKERKAILIGKKNHKIFQSSSCYRQQENKMMDSPVLKQLDMELVGGCNYACIMCPHGINGREHDFKKALPYDVFMKIVDDAISCGVEGISLHGSGEPTLCKWLPEAVQYIKKKNQKIKVMIVTNGFRLTDDLSKRLIDSDLDLLRVSVIGYDATTYKRLMMHDGFDIVKRNAENYKNLLEIRNAPGELHSYHTIINQNNIDFEVKEYQKNWITPVGSMAEIWLLHNWAGSFDGGSERTKPNKRTCGRMFKPMLQVRAGANGKGRYGSVAPCCMVLGQDSRAELGTLDTQSIADVMNGEQMKHLRMMHAEGRWDEIDYCKGCDQLYEAPESLIWTNITDRKYNHSKLITGMKLIDD